MRVTLLGPVAAESGGVALRLGGPKQIAVFALLALNANRVVSLDRLVDELWSDEPPSGATLVLQSYVSRLRRMLSGMTPSDGIAPRILTRAPGWVLTLPADDVDATRFISSLAEARLLVSTGQLSDAAVAVRLLQGALELWRGEALSDLSALRFAREEAAGLQELRLGAMELLLEAMLLVGEHDAVAEQARRFVAGNPFRERAWSALMVALYRSGRQSEALAAAAELRLTLANELGLDPSPQVGDIEERILRQDPTLLIPKSSGSWKPDEPARALPRAPEAGAAPVRQLVGRDAALAAVDVAVADLAARRGRVLVLQAPAGSGKSTMMQLLAQQVAAAGGIALQARGAGSGTTPALWPWVAIVRQLAELLPGAVAADTKANNGLITATLSLMQSVPGTSADDAGHDAVLDRSSLYRGLIDLLSKACNERPTAVLLDDAQWIDADSLALLSLALDDLVCAGLLFAVAIRTDEPDSADVANALARVRRELVVKVPLPALSAPDIAELISVQSGRHDAALSAAIHARTGGSPLFVSELIRLLSSERRLTAEGVAAALPDEVRDVLRLRLARLPEQTLTLLGVAAVAGAATDVGLLATVSGLEADAVLDACDSALAAGLLHEDPERFDGFALSHDLVRQTIEESMSGARRVRLHAKVGAALQARSEPSAQQVADIAHHLAIAAPIVGPAAAVPYLIAASEDALKRFGSEQGEQYLRSALDLIGQIDEPDRRAQLGRQVHGQLAALLAYTKGVLPDAPGEAGLSVPLMVDADSAAGWLGTTVMTAVRGHFEMSIATAEKALDLKPPPAGAIAAHYVIGWANFVCGRLDRARSGFAAMDELVADGVSTGPTGALSAVAVAGAGHQALMSHITGDEIAADEWLTIAARRAGKADVSLVNVELAACWLSVMRGDSSRTRTHAAACSELAKRLQFPLFLKQAAVVAAWADAMQGDAAGAARLDAAYDDYVATGIRMFLPMYLLLRAEVQLTIGNPALAMEHVTASRSASAETGDVCLGPRLVALGRLLAPLSN